MTFDGWLGVARQIARMAMIAGHHSRDTRAPVVEVHLTVPRQERWDEKPEEKIDDAKKWYAHCGSLPTAHGPAPEAALIAAIDIWGRIVAKRAHDAREQANRAEQDWLETEALMCVLQEAEVPR